MLLKTQTSTPSSPLPQLSSPLLPSPSLPLPFTYIINKPMNQPSQNQPWIWSPTTMVSHPNYFQLDHQDQQKGNDHGGRRRREQMFEKPLTPSDVGKLNRLVIPKQYAEKYFPLDGESGEKGLLLSFEDELGKLWKFRYSYWTSSQSYVLTKGWSRFVKEKRLDAGDAVVFERCHLGGSLYIACRRRGSGDQASTAAAAPSPTLYGAPCAYPSPPYYYMNSVHSGGNAAGAVEKTATVATTKRLRLFGVNLECPEPQHSASGSWMNQFLPTDASTSQL